MQNSERGAFLLEAAFLVLCLGALGAVALPLPDENGNCKVRGTWDGQTFVDLTCTKVGCGQKCEITNLGSPGLEVCECPGQTDQTCTTVVEVNHGEVVGYFCLQLDDCFVPQQTCHEETGIAVGNQGTVCLCY